MAVIDPNLEWLGYVQPVGLVLSPAILDRYGLVPEEQTRADGDAVARCIAPEGEARALADPWVFFSRILGWREHQVTGLTGGRPLPDRLSVTIDEADTVLEPHWAVVDPEGRTTLLVRIEGPGVAPHQRGAFAGWPATPHQRFERLLRENEAGVRAGILLTDDQLRLVYAPKGETSGWLSFPLRALATVAGRPMLGGLKNVLNAAMLHNRPQDQRLPALLKQSRDAQAEVSGKLAEQVLGSLHQLLRGLHAADEERIARVAKEQPDQLYGGLLTVLLRLVFLLYAEDRGLIPSATDDEARRLYDQGYGVRALHAKLTADAARYPDTMEERRGAWARLLVLFRLVHKGGGDGFITGRGGDLFDPVIYPFLLGQDAAGAPVAPAPVSDGCILGVLDKLLVLDGERLSYRTLDVEQIGSVYETVMGFTVETMGGPALALRGGKNDKVPVFVDLAELAALKGSERQKRLKDAYDIKLPDKVAKAVALAKTQAELEAALKPRGDERASPGAMLALPGAPLLQPTDERRRTGSHYTPRTLTEPIVRHALEPAFERLGPDAKPEDVLALKVCDPAIGSGAFLVEACRQLAARLVKAWTRWPQTRPRIPDDEDDELHAKRLVAQRCLYGVDKNPRAVELAKLSLWLATLAREHEFTFLDHALKCGDSLVGLDAAQIAAMHWDTSKPGLPLFRKFVADRVAEATKARSEIQSAPDDTRRAVLEQKHKQVEKSVEHVRVLGDAVVSAFFSEERPRAREKRRATIESWVTGIGEAKWEELRAAATSLRAAEHPLRPFHWAIEYPEVFSRENGGFQAIVGNPPFLGGKSISTAFGDAYSWWLEINHSGGTRSADLVAHFFRRAFALLRQDGCFGLIATNTISQGDTRATGLAAIISAGGAIRRAVKRLQWPGEAAVVVSVVHVAKGKVRSQILDGRPVSRISAYLVEGEMDETPARLHENARRAFIGSFVLGMGFTFDDEAAAKGIAESLATLNALIAKDPRNSERIFPYIGGEEVNNSPTLAHDRYTIDFFDFPLRRDPSFRSWFEWSEKRVRQGLREGIVPVDYPRHVAEDWPDLIEIIQRRVKPDRDKQKRKAVRERWWQYADKRPGLYATIAPLKRVLVTNCGAAPHLALGVVPTGTVFAHTLAVIAFPNLAPFATLQSRPHEVWARFFASSMKDDLRYTPSDCFETFPFPEGFETSRALETIGQTYRHHRAALMVARNEGMTKTYNRFHDPDERSEDIVRLRELHAEMDRAVLRAYGWDDLGARAEPIFLDETNEDDHTYQGRLFWPSAFRDEVLARLLALNAERHAEEVRLGIAPGMKGEVREADEEGEDDDDDADERRQLRLG
ncbi:MAG: N-6 DNA methylase [Hyphomicrobiales bacterium]|nr:N-6 DNA methylase [Hyphomicrobiales bacterium]